MFNNYWRLIILGKCPHCGATDSCFVEEGFIPTRKPAKCRECEESWEWFLNKNQNHWPVFIQIWPQRAEATLQRKNNTPFFDRLNDSLLALTASRFRLEKNGNKILGQSLTLAKAPECIGLRAENLEKPASEFQIEVFKFYGHLIESLFLRKLKLGETNFGRGLYLRTDWKQYSKDEEFPDLAVRFLWIALTNVVGNYVDAGLLCEKSGICLPDDLIREIRK